MIKKYKWNILAFLVFQTAVLFLFLIQTAVQPHGLRVLPQLWLAVPFFFAVYKPLFQTVLMMYFTSLIFASGSSMPFGQILCLMTLICMTAWAVRTLMNLKEIKIFILSYMLFILFLPWIDWGLSILTAAGPLHPYSFFNWALVVLVTSLWMSLLAPLFLWINKSILKLGENEEESKLMKTPPVRLFENKGRLK